MVEKVKEVVQKEVAEKKEEKIEHKVTTEKKETTTKPTETKKGHTEKPSVEKKEFSDGKKFEKRDFSSGKRFERRDFRQREPYVPKKEEESKPVFIKKKSQFAQHKIFNKWSLDEVVVSDPSLVRYINLEPMIVPHSFGRKSQGKFAKQNINVVERLVNKTMRSGQGKRKLSGKYIRGRNGCGKKIQSMSIVEGAFEIIEVKTKKNPVQVLVDALQNVTPHEDVTRVKRGGVSYALAVDVAPLKGLDESLKNIALAGFGNSFNKKVSAEEALAEEIIAAAANDPKSLAIKRKDEVERIAKASR